MQSLPSLPEGPLLRWLIVMACISVIGLLAACARACWKRDALQVRRTVLPVAILLVGLAVGHHVRLVHTPAMIVVLVLATWNVRRSNGVVKWASGVGAIGMLGSIIAAALLF